MKIEPEKLGKIVRDIVAEVKNQPHPPDDECEACLVKRAIFSTPEVRVVARSMFKTFMTEAGILEGGITVNGLLEAITVGFDLALRYVKEGEKDKEPGEIVN